VLNVCKLTKLRELYVWDTDIEGEIDRCIFNLVEIEVIDIFQMGKVSLELGTFLCNAVNLKYLNLNSKIIS
jgi:hypothetical protein